MKKDLKELIKKLEVADGGFSYSLLGKKEPQKGYMVSDKAHLEKFVYENIEEEIEKFLKENIEILKNENYFLGAWRDPEDFHVGLSISKNVASFEEAYKIAQENKQISFYDLANKKSIRIKY